VSQANNIILWPAEHRAEVQGLLAPTLAGWCEQLSRVLSAPLAPETMAAWGAQLEALKVLTLLAAHFGKALAPHAPALAHHVWQMFSGEPSSSQGIGPAFRRPGRPRLAHGVL